MVVKVNAEGKNREEMKRLADIFRGAVIDVTPKTYIIQIAGDEHKLDAFIRAIGVANIMEVARTGTCGILRGD